MRIRSTTDAVQSFTRITEKQDNGGFGDRGQRHERQKDPESNKEEVHVEPSYEAVNQALESFVADKQTQENGIHAEVSGQGPGLKVVLKDGSGAVIRQLTGEEFVRLRETVQPDAKGRGKILDQKL